MMFRHSPLTTRDVRSYRSLIYGFSALWILFAHSHSRIPAGILFEPLRWFRINGIAVEVFTLLSGLSLYHSMEKAPRDIRGFYRRRFARVVPPTFIVTAICFGLVSWIDIPEYIGALLILPYWFGAPALWYAAFILTMYLVYPLIYHMQKKCPVCVWLLTALSVAFSALSFYVLMPGNNHYLMPIARIPIFLLGCALAPWSERGGEIPRWAAPAALAAYIAIAVTPNAISDSFLRATSYQFLSIFAVIALTWLARLLTRMRAAQFFCAILSYCGGISLEIYLVYSRLLYFMMLLPVYKSGGIGHFKLECMTILLTFIICPVLRRACSFRLRAPSPSSGA